MTSFDFIKIFSDVPQGSILATLDVGYLFYQNRIDFFPSMFRIQTDKWSLLEICLKFL